MPSINFSILGGTKVFEPCCPERNEKNVRTLEGLAFGDDSGLGAAVVWQRNGLIRGLAGPQPRSLLLELAEG